MTCKRAKGREFGRPQLSNHFAMGIHSSPRGLDILMAKQFGYKVPETGGFLLCRAISFPKQSLYLCQSRQAYAVMQRHLPYRTTTCIMEVMPTQDITGILLAGPEWEEKEVELEETDVGGDEPSQLVVYNDDYNTFEWVIQCFMEVLRYDSIQAEQLAHIIHFKGKATVKTAPLKELKPLKDALIDRGLSAVIE